jgi:hypothetical protein
MPIHVLLNQMWFYTLLHVHDPTIAFISEMKGSTYVRKMAWLSSFILLETTIKKKMEVQKINQNPKDEH